jgi:hypothetical protein
MKVSELFDGILGNLKVDNKTDSATRRGETAKVLNKDFRARAASTSNQLRPAPMGALPPELVT